MSDSENRQIARDSLFVLTDLRVEGQDGEHRVKMRNLSAGGMMAEGTVRVRGGAIVSVNLRNVGWTKGSVAWIEGNRFGVAFAEDIDPVPARKPEAAPPPHDGLIIPRSRSPRRDRTGPVRQI